MAEIKVTGEVTRVFSKGFDVTERRESNGREFKQRFTVWGGEAQSGERVTVTGLVSVKDDEWTDRDGNTRHTPQVSINQPKITHERTQPADESAPFDYSDSTPF